MRKIICRFANQTDLDVFNKQNGLSLTKDVKEYDFRTNTAIYKRTGKLKGFDTSWKPMWADMPDFVEPKVVDFAKIDFIVDEDAPLSTIFSQPTTKKTKSLWFPKLEPHKKRYFRVIGGENPKYPVYVVSKGRSDIRRCKTILYLNLMAVKHFVVVEPDEVSKYADMVNRDKLIFTTVLPLDMRFVEAYETLDNRGTEIGKGPGGARNFCWFHSKTALKSPYHWVMDDNIDGFHYLTRNVKWKMRTGAGLAIAEEFFTRFSNIAIGSLNYSKFVKECDCVPPYIINTRMYSCLFIKNDIPFEWRGRYNEDTILSLDVLTSGKYCTCQLNAFLADKLTTTRVKGGNTDMFYDKEGTYNKSKMLVDEYPEYAKMVYKFSRVHHYVDYSSFKQSLVPSVFVYDLESNQKGMEIVKIPVEWDGDREKDNREYIESHIEECKKISLDNFEL